MIRLRSIVMTLGLAGAAICGCGHPTEPGPPAPSTPASSPPAPSTPPMGWNSWNSAIPLNEQTVEATIDAMVGSGMRDAGYRYVNLDAGWAAPTRGPHGELQADPAKFPHGIAALTRYAHDRGMLLGLYASPYNERCGQAPATASAGHEQSDARTFAAWGVDFLKYDWCFDNADHDRQVQVFTAMRNALADSGRHILYSINPNSSDDHTAGVRYDWSGIADMDRNAGDLVPVWRSTLPPLGRTDSFVTGGNLGVPDEFAAAAPAAKRSRPGHWNDPDMLVVGLDWAQYFTAHLQNMHAAQNANQLTPDELFRHAAELALSPDQVAWRAAAQPALTETEQRTHFSLWAMLAAPLIASNDVRTMSESTRSILTNRDVIAVDQDPLVVQATALPSDSRVLVKPLADGGAAVALFNPDTGPTRIATTASAVGLRNASCYSVRDLWTHTESRTQGEISSQSVPAHGTVMLRISPGC